MKKKILFCFFISTFLVTSLKAYEQKLNKSSEQKVSELENLDVKERLGETLDLSVKVQDSKGKTRTLGEFFSGPLPVLMTVVYYECPNLCPLHIDGLVNSFKELPKNWTAGKDFKFLALSMDHREGQKQASSKKRALLKQFGRDNVEDKWYFLTATKESIQKITNQLGFQFRWDEASSQYAHPALAYLMTSEAKISSYLYGLTWKPQDLKLALTEAGRGKSGSFIDRLVLFCFQFNPAKNKYTLYAYNIMRLAGLLTVIVMLIFFIPFWLKNLKVLS